MIRDIAYKAKQFNLKGLEGISDIARSIPTLTGKLFRDVCGRTKNDMPWHAIACATLARDLGGGFDDEQKPTLRSSLMIGT